MSNVPKFICPECDSDNCELQFSVVDGHRIPGFWRCLEPGCGWEGKLRKCVFVDVPDQPSPYTKKTTATVRRAQTGTTSLMSKEDKDGIVIVLPSMTEAWKETMDKIAAISAELDEGPHTTCPLSCPCCREPLVEILTSCAGTVKWTYLAPAKPEDASGWYWHVQETWSFRCPVCEEGLTFENLEEIPYIRRKEYLDEE